MLLFISNLEWRQLSSILFEQDIVLSDSDEKPVKEVTHIPRVTSEIMWIENTDWFMKIDHSGRVLFKRNIHVFWGCSSFTVDENGDVFYINEGIEVIKMSSTGENPTQLLKVDDQFKICNICFARSTGEILIRVYFQQLNKHRTYIERYNKNGERLSQFKYKEYKKLLTSPWFVSVNINGNICVSDQLDSKVRGFDDQGKKLYTYKGRRPRAFNPTGICNDLLGHVLVCNCHKSNPSVHLLDKNGQFLKMIVYDRKDVKEPWGLCTDDDGKLYLGQKNCKMIKVFLKMSHKVLNDISFHFQCFPL